MGSCFDGRRQGSPPPSPGGAPGRRRRRPEDDVPRRLCSNGATDSASLFTKQGKKGINQDAMIVWEDFGSREGTIFCGVFDGHGPFGHMVARKVRSSLPSKLSALWNENTVDDLSDKSNCDSGSMDCGKTAPVSDGLYSCICNGSDTSIDFKGNEQNSDIFLTIKESLIKAYEVMDKELKFTRKINCFSSGTTAVTLVKQGQEIIIGNLGDSRAILGTRDKENTLVAFQLTVDLKPNLPEPVKLTPLIVGKGIVLVVSELVKKDDKYWTSSSDVRNDHSICCRQVASIGEEERIRQCNGRVFALKEEPEVTRVWLPKVDSPGLAMARAFGDLCLKDFGLISVPEISHRRLTENDEFIVLATDGVWDVLSNQEAVDIIASAPTRSSAARFLVESAVSAWKEKYPTSKIDDVAVVCLYLNADSSSSSSADSNHDLEDSCETMECSSEKILNGAKGSHGTASRSSLRKRNFGNTDMTTDDIDWSALEGVSRANTLLKLP